MSKFTQTITVEENGETLIFKIGFNDFKQFEENLSLVVSSECVVDIAEMGEWEIL
jgi:hypothetical protein